MKNLLALLLCLIALLGYGQKSKKGFEYSGTKTRNSIIGKSTVFSEAIKNQPFTIYWNKQKQTIRVEAGAKDKHYTIYITAPDSMIFGHVTQFGYLSGYEKAKTPEEMLKFQCEVRFSLEKISIKIADARIEDYLVDGATVWGE